MSQQYLRPHCNLKLVSAKPYLRVVHKLLKIAQNTVSKLFETLILTCFNYNNIIAFDLNYINVIKPVELKKIKDQFGPGMVHFSNHVVSSGHYVKGCPCQ